MICFYISLSAMIVVHSSLDSKGGDVNNNSYDDLGGGGDFDLDGFNGESEEDEGGELEESEEDEGGELEESEEGGLIGNRGAVPNTSGSGLFKMLLFQPRTRS